MIANSSPAHARHRVVLAHRGPQPLGHLHQQLVADAVAARVVDQLEPVEVEVEHRHAALACLRALDRLLQALLEHHAVDQLGQVVVVREVAHLLFRDPPLGDVGDRSAPCRRLASCTLWISQDAARSGAHARRSAADLATDPPCRPKGGVSSLRELLDRALILHHLVERRAPLHQLRRQVEHLHRAARCRPPPCGRRSTIMIPWFMCASAVCRPPTAPPAAPARLPDSSNAWPPAALRPLQRARSAAPARLRQLQPADTALSSAAQQDHAQHSVASACTARPATAACRQADSASHSATLTLTTSG